tara:strand:+ start:7344 stop:7535 length:192 start_codon:yes stop_codon:yes gene_type:complete
MDHKEVYKEAIRCALEKNNKVMEKASLLSSIPLIIYDGKNDQYIKQAVLLTYDLGKSLVDLLI